MAIKNIIVFYYLQYIYIFFNIMSMIKYNSIVHLQMNLNCTITIHFSQNIIVYLTYGT